MRRSALMAAAVTLTALCCDAPEPTFNHRPSAPHVEGPDQVMVGEQAEFSVEVYDPDGNSLRVFVAWGDGDTSDYGEFVSSGRVVYFEHRYVIADTFTLRARCHDTEPLFSEWSTPRQVVAVNP